MYLVGEDKSKSFGDTKINHMETANLFLAPCVR